MRQERVHPLPLEHRGGSVPFVGIGERFGAEDVRRGLVGWIVIVCMRSLGVGLSFRFYSLIRFVWMM